MVDELLPIGNRALIINFGILLPPSLRRGLQYGSHLFRSNRVLQHSVDSKQFQQLADVWCLARLHDHDDLRLRRNGLQGSQGDVEVRHSRSRVIVAPAIDELTHKKIRRLFFARPGVGYGQS